MPSPKSDSNNETLANMQRRLLVKKKPVKKRENLTLTRNQQIKARVQRARIRAERSLKSPPKNSNRFYNASNTFDVPTLTEAQVKVLNTKHILNKNYNKEINKLLKTRLERDGNVFFNANNKSFPINKNVSVAMRKNNANLLIKERMAVTKRLFPSVDVKKLESESKKVARTIAKFIESGQFLNALRVTGSLFAIIYLFKHNPRAVDNTLNLFMKQPLFRPIGRTIPSEQWNSKLKVKITKLWSAFSASPTFSQSIYESFLATIPTNAYGRSVTGISVQYLSMVILALIAILPYEKQTKFCRQYLDYIFKVLDKLFALASTIVTDVLVERGDSTRVRLGAVVRGAISAAPLITTALGK
tara:strand:- start:927 stop:2000 length:1074 start_codon:yes stop_codon:yes gene_type:complete